MGSPEYIRDGRAPVPKDPVTSKVMSRIRARDTGPERLMRAALRAAGSRGYRLNYKRVPGRPDIAYVGKKVAVFVHGCFWHGCPYCKPARPQSNKSFWTRKLARNKVRDKEKERALVRLGWKVITVWECRLKRAPDKQAARVTRALQGR